MAESDLKPRQAEGDMEELENDSRSEHHGK